MKTAAVFGGAGLGILMGLLIGLSTSGTVGIVIGSITSILLVLLGFKDTIQPLEQALRVGAFGFSCVATILLGLYIRVNDSFAPSVHDAIQQWTQDSLFSLPEAKQYVVYDKFGFMPSGAVLDSVRGNNPGETVLYSVEISPENCEDLKGYENFPIENELEGYRIKGGIWKNIADQISADLPVEQQKHVLHLMRKSLCDE